MAILVVVVKFVMRGFYPLLRAGSWVAAPGALGLHGAVA